MHSYYYTHVFYNVNIILKFYLFLEVINDIKFQSNALLGISIALENLNHDVLICMFAH